MLVRNLKKAGDYERAILSQEENLRMAIANDRAIALARSQAAQGMVPPLTTQQLRSKEEELTDAVAINSKTRDNLLTLYKPETVASFMEGMSQDDKVYLNVYWNDLKEVLKTKSGLTKRYFDRILAKHIQGVIDSRGMSTVPSSGTRNASLNEPGELTRLTLVRDDPVIGKLLVRLRSGGRPADEAKAQAIAAALDELRKFLPTQQAIQKASALPDAEKQAWFRKVIQNFEGLEPNKDVWTAAAVETRMADVNTKAERLFRPLTENQKRDLQLLYL
jgi:membrane-bound lytic murein transglycosylase